MKLMEIESFKSSKGHELRSVTFINEIFCIDLNQNPSEG